LSAEQLLLGLLLQRSSGYYSWRADPSSTTGVDLSPVLTELKIAQLM
jgi:hypothetical protein